ncbi:MAG: type II toxin-antitoxin system VapB family antitoxin [Phyllobacteriaceae bacterium]|nr:type II toxin-antitoxin system VapB family antitoxin [Phyllobacteriaceae bacterium]
MAFHIKNPETDALARKVARIKRTSLTAAVHQALQHEIERAGGQSGFVEEAMEMIRRFQEKGDRAKGLAADRDFIDSLYE